MQEVHIVECPRDAMQGLPYHVPASEKTVYLNSLLQCGFHTLDCGSFVNPSAVPQMADTAEVLKAIGNHKGNTRLLVIVANERGAKNASAFEAIDDLGFPLSINQTFQLRNTNTQIENAYDRLGKICDTADAFNKNVVAYISMAFGNPYGDIYHRDDVLLWTEKLIQLGIKTISLADTVGSAKSEDITYLFNHIHAQWPELETGAHFHSRPNLWAEKVEAAFLAGCRRFDGALLGYGGCPFADDDLTGNLPTEGLIQWFKGKATLNIQTDNLVDAMLQANGIFQSH